MASWNSGKPLISLASELIISIIIATGEDLDPRKRPRNQHGGTNFFSTYLVDD